MINDVFLLVYVIILFVLYIRNITFFWGGESQCTPPPLYATLIMSQIYVDHYHQS